ncbi:conserved protein of unknown function [Candidatus Hydrogenisulfobacillus filiaventi]|uniref:Eco29kI family restriction endonuclease n=1 Tax=Candidatus Hydrogenisulfobacillus filiaventi TaxID=2707344 RepID=A0A6F8ZIY4_9FIRM|nr:conserved protein of unknown function [Candidatus Hydrogenisulfobacillus filiaventi]
MRRDRPQRSLPLIDHLRQIVEEIKGLGESANPRVARRLRRAVRPEIQNLLEAIDALDPVARPRSFFDPTDPRTAGTMAALLLVAQPRYALEGLPAFYGAGVYALYYTGAFPAYAPISGTDHPIYIGKADPVDPSAKLPEAQGTALYQRLREHAESIGMAATTLRLADFECRFLITQSGFQKAAEDSLIRFFRPIWNSETQICFGLGKHGDSAKTRRNKRSPWDTMHPGRPWATSIATDQKPPELIERQISEHFLSNPIYKDFRQILDLFLKDTLQLVAPAVFSSRITTKDEDRAEDD